MRVIFRSEYPAWRVLWPKIAHRSRPRIMHRGPFRSEPACAVFWPQNYYSNAAHPTIVALIKKKHKEKVHSPLFQLYGLLLVRLEGQGLLWCPKHRRRNGCEQIERGRLCVCAFYPMVEKVPLSKIGMQICKQACMMDENWIPYHLPQPKSTSTYWWFLHPLNPLNTIFFIYNPISKPGRHAFSIYNNITLIINWTA